MLPSCFLFLLSFYDNIFVYAYSNALVRGDGGGQGATLMLMLILLMLMLMLLISASHTYSREDEHGPHVREGGTPACGQKSRREGKINEVEALSGRSQGVSCPWRWGG